MTEDKAQDIKAQVEDLVEAVGTLTLAEVAEVLGALTTRLDELASEIPEVAG